MKHDDEKPLTPAQVRQFVLKGLADYLLDSDKGSTSFPLKQPGKVNETYSLKLTQKQRETLVECTEMSPDLKKKLEQAGVRTQIVPLTWNELKHLNGLAQEKWARGERLDGLLEHYGREVSQSRVPSD